MALTRIEIVLGCMYSGKSTELIRRCGRYKAIGKKILMINHSLDIRIGNSVMTHKKDTVDAKLTILVRKVSMSPSLEPFKIIQS